MSKVMVFKVSISNNKNKERQKAISAVSSLERIDSIEVSAGGDTMTVRGGADPADILKKLRRYMVANIISVGPVEEEMQNVQEIMWTKYNSNYNNYYNPPWTALPPPPPPQPLPLPPPQYDYYTGSYEDNPNGCVIC